MTNTNNCAVCSTQADLRKVTRSVNAYKLQLLQNGYKAVKQVGHDMSTAFVRISEVKTLLLSCFGLVASLVRHSDSIVQHQWL